MESTQVCKTAEGRRVQINMQSRSPPPPCVVPSGLTFWERHEAQTAADLPPASEGARVLIALIRTVKEPSWYFGVYCFVWFSFLQKSFKGEKKKEM